MVFVFGGAYQGMEDYVRQRFGAQDMLMLDESSREIDFSRKYIGGLERYVLGCVRRDEDARLYFRAHEAEWRDCVLIGIDFSCGLVPMDAEKRRWRDENGRLNNELSARADSVVRMFCGIAQVLK